VLRKLPCSTAHSQLGCLAHFIRFCTLGWQQCRPLSCCAAANCLLPVCCSNHPQVMLHLLPRARPAAGLVMPLAWQMLWQRASSVAQAAHLRLLLRPALALLQHSLARMLRRVWAMLLLRTRLLLLDRAQQWHRDPQVSWISSQHTSTDSVKNCAQPLDGLSSREHHWLISTAFQGP
jgi:hypothetical protein